MEDRLVTVAKQHFELMPEFPHLALAHLALAIQGDDPDLNRGDLGSFLAWALKQPGAEGEWGHCGAWLKFLCPRRYDHTKLSRDYTSLRKHFPAAAEVIKAVTEKPAAPKRFSIYLDASTQVLKSTPTPGKRRMSAALLLGNELVARLDEAGFEVRFNYEADQDGVPNEPHAEDSALYLSYRIPLTVSACACVASREEASPVAAALLDAFKEIGMMTFGDASLEVHPDLPAAQKASIMIDFPIAPRGSPDELKLWACNYAGAVVKALIAIDNSFNFRAG